MVIKTRKRRKKAVVGVKHVLTACTVLEYDFKRTCHIQDHNSMLLAELVSLNAKSISPPCWKPSSLQPQTRSKIKKKLYRHLIWSALLNAVQGIEHWLLSQKGKWNNLHAVSYYTPQEVNTIIQITRHLSNSCGRVKTKMPFLHAHLHRAQYATDLGHETQNTSGTAS